MSETSDRVLSRVARNSFWYGFDQLLGILIAVGISIPMARVMGAERLGYFNYIMWLSAMSGGLCSLGVPQTTGKYMAEYLGRGDRGMARSVYQRSLHIQATMATVLTAIALAILYTFGDPQYHLVSTIQILATIPTMLVQVPTHANVANESMRTNIPGSLASNVILLIAVPLSLMVHWDLLGIASGVLISRVVDLVIRSRSTRRWVNLVPASPIPRELSDTMRSFGLKATYISLVAMVIWDKSDLVLLKALTTDIGQITFFTMAYNLVEKVILAPAVFGASLSASLMAQYGRDRGKTPALAAQAIRYLYLFSLPMLLGLSLTSDPLIRVLYGSGFLPAIRVLQFAGVLAILKPVSYASDAMFRATGRQKMVVIWTTLGAFQNVLLDYLLIPRYGAVGAAIGSGVAVSTQVVIYLIILKASFDVPLDVKGLGKITLAGLLMAAPVLVSNAFLPPLAAVLIDPVAGGAIFLLAIKAFRLLHETDVERLGRLCDMFPSSVRPLLYRLIGFLATSAPLQPVADPQ